MTFCQRQLWICLVHEFEFSVDFNVLQQRKESAHLRKLQEIKKFTSVILLTECNNQFQNYESLVAQVLFLYLPFFGLFVKIRESSAFLVSE